MRYSRVFIEAIGYELALRGRHLGRAGAAALGRLRDLAHPPGTARSPDRDRRAPVVGPGVPDLRGGRGGGQARLLGSSVSPKDVEVLIYAGVCRELFEPATACRVASRVGVSTGAAIYDLSNACLGVLNGMVDIANRIELGQIRAGMVVSCETSREIVDIAIDKMRTPGRWTTSRTRWPP